MNVRKCPYIDGECGRHAQCKKCGGFVVAMDGIQFSGIVHKTFEGAHREAIKAKDDPFFVGGHFTIRRVGA